jgi:hypothetical protein
MTSSLRDRDGRRIRHLRTVVPHGHPRAVARALAAKLGWMLDAMDFMLYTMAVGQLRNYFQFGDDVAGHARAP